MFSVLKESLANTIKYLTLSCPFCEYLIISIHKTVLIYTPDFKISSKAYLDQHAQENYLVGLPEFSQSSSILSSSQL